MGAVSACLPVSLSPAVRVDNVSKKFKLFASPANRLKEALHPFRKKYHNDFWALKDVSFSVPPGQTVGILGRNGSGKSTLLQVICSILRPTLGSVSACGRIAALLELGAGFNPEFTGRDNAIFQCRLSGLTINETRHRLELIREFAEIGQFFDQPVKTYSSGMFVRLAFATAINVDPDILVIDEALAVGDARFQRKCYQQFLDYQQGHKTILLVTHSIDIVARHCDRAILLDQGRLVKDGDPKEVGDAYTELLFGLAVDGGKRTLAKTNAIKPVSSQVDADGKLDEFLFTHPGGDRCPSRCTYNKSEYVYGEGGGAIVDYLVVSGSSQDPSVLQAHTCVDLYVKVVYEREVRSPTFGVTIQTLEGMIVSGSSTNLRKVVVRPVQPGDVRIFKIRLQLALRAGDYFVSCGIADHGDELHMLQCRNDLIHLMVGNEHPVSGVADLGIRISDETPANVEAKTCL